MSQVIGLIGYASLCAVILAYATGWLPIRELALGMILGGLAVGTISAQLWVRRGVWARRDDALLACQNARLTGTPAQAPPRARTIC
jgi:hypothetical protein